MTTRHLLVIGGFSTEQHEVIDQRSEFDGYQRVKISFAQALRLQQYYSAARPTGGSMYDELNQLIRMVHQLTGTWIEANHFAVVYDLPSWVALANQYPGRKPEANTSIFSSFELGEFIFDDVDDPNALNKPTPLVFAEGSQR